MTELELKRVSQTFAAMAAYYRSRLDDVVCKMYADDMADLAFVDVMSALTQYRKNPKNKFAPMPAQIRDLLAPEVDIDSAAREIASRICGAIPKFGWTDRIGASAHIGEAGWGIVESLGGWQFLCERMGTLIDPSTFQAQIRDLAKARLSFPQEAMHSAIGIESRKPVAIAPGKTLEIKSSAQIINEGLANVFSTKETL